MTAFLDTHAAILLYEGKTRAFGKESRRLLDSSPLAWSPAVRLEMAFLRQAGKIKEEPDTVLGRLATEHSAFQSEESFAQVVDRAMDLTWTRDPFDRLIVATAETHCAPLITRDDLIHENSRLAVW